jgi:hypothetical protein
MLSKRTSWGYTAYSIQYTAYSIQYTVYITHGKIRLYESILEKPGGKKLIR